MSEVLTGADPDDIRKGNTCLVTVLDDHFMSRILDVTDDTIGVSFPAADYPIEGMLVELEFHDKHGFNRYPAQVVAGPTIESGQILLKRPTQCFRSQHRSSCRVPTDLTVQVKDEVHVRRYDADLLNLSGGGALIRTHAPFDYDTTVDITVSLPGESTHTVLGKIVHFAEEDRHREHPTMKLFGIRFIGLDPGVQESITRYLWARLRDLYQVS